ncbi:hypothetical protein LT493_28325 [Streptomyces tricolor]|nr:hypothetical protein [Streptomyces tricolor]
MSPAPPAPPSAAPKNPDPATSTTPATSRRPTSPPPTSPSPHSPSPKRARSRRSKSPAPVPAAPATTSTSATAPSTGAWWECSTTTTARSRCRPSGGRPVRWDRWSSGCGRHGRCRGCPTCRRTSPATATRALRALLARTGLVLLLGEPYAGTSYTAWHAVRSLESHRVYAPDPGADLRPLAAALRGSPGRYVVWLDGLTDHLGPGRLDLPLLGRLNDLGAVVLATMRPAEYYRRRAGTAPGDRVVAAARTVELRREWSEAELARLSAHDDPRAYPAYLWSGREGVGSYFAVGHLLFDEWRRAGTRQEHPLGRLLVRAAVDVARCGVTGAVPAELLAKVLPGTGRRSGKRRNASRSRTRSTGRPRPCSASPGCSWRVSGPAPGGRTGRWSRRRWRRRTWSRSRTRCGGRCWTRPSPGRRWTTA